MNSSESIKNFTYAIYLFLINFFKDICFLLISLKSTAFGNTSMVLSLDFFKFVILEGITISLILYLIKGSKKLCILSIILNLMNLILFVSYFKTGTSIWVLLKSLTPITGNIILIILTIMILYKKNGALFSHSAGNI